MSLLDYFKIIFTSPTFWNTVLGLILLYVVSTFFNWIQKSKIYLSIVKSKIFIKVSTLVTSVFTSMITIAFVVTLIIGAAGLVLDETKFPDFTLQLGIAALTLAAFTLTMASLKSKSRFTSKTKKFIEFSEDFVSGGIYFVFAYLFRLIVDYYSTGIGFFRMVHDLYSVFAVISAIAGVFTISKAMWNLLKTINPN